jgi:homogentisate 1,2-dioxygenase
MTPSTHLVTDPFSAVADAARARGARRVLIVCGPSRRFVDRLLPGLAFAEVEVFDRAQAHVPVEVVEAAEARRAAFDPDLVVAIGGGAATGLAKILRVRHGLSFFALPTTLAGSEMTSIHGLTRGRTKETGRDERARPDAVFHAPELLRALPRRSLLQSLFNALAHPVSALSAGLEGEAERAAAREAIGSLTSSAFHLAQAPGHGAALEAALGGAARAGEILDRGPLGAHHRIAHRLGGRFALPHAALHALLLPHTLRDLRDAQPDTFREIAAAAGLPDLPGHLFELLRRVEAETSLRELGVPWAELSALLGDDLPSDLAARVFLGRDPAAPFAPVDVGLGAPGARAGEELAAAEVVVVAVHDGGGTAEAAARQVLEVASHAPGLAIIAPQAPPDGGDQAPAAAGVRTALERARSEAPNARVVVMGFGRGAAVAVEAATGGSSEVDALIALGAAPRVSTPVPAHLRGVPVLLGFAADDVDADAAADALAAAGAEVERLVEPVDAPAPSARQRLRAGERIRGRSRRGGEAGFANVHATEALPGALPPRQNSPRRAPHGLYAEQINGTSFVAPRADNRRSWLYRIRPSAQHSRFQPLAHPTFGGVEESAPPDPNLVGHAPLPLPEAPTDFVDGLHTYGGSGSPALRRGFAVHLYAANRSMDHRSLANADGDFLLVPEHGALTLLTDMGVLDVAPGSVALVPRGVRFAVLLQDAAARGYLAEVYGRHFELPERGPVGSNGLTEARHFVAPRAWYEDRLDLGHRLVTKLGGRLHEARQDYSPFDVVAWHGNYSPYVYDLLDFSPVANVRFDHGDPSVYTVLTAPLDEAGAHALDFVFFPPRWDPTEGTFRPPFFHRNATTEINGIIREPSAEGSPFRAGCVFLTPPMTPHGVRSAGVQRAITAAEDPPPHRTSERSMWFQFESALPLRLTRWACESPTRVEDWAEMWGAHPSRFTPSARDPE